MSQERTGTRMKHKGGRERREKEETRGSSRNEELFPPFPGPDEPVDSERITHSLTRT